MRASLLLLALVALIAGGCKADTDIGDDVASAPATDAPAPTATPDPNDPDLAARLLLDDAVLGTGWTAEPRSDADADQAAETLAIASSTPGCEALVASGLLDDGELGLVDDAPTNLEGPTWARGPDEVEFTVSIYQTIDDATVPFRRAADLAVAPCYESLLPALFEFALSEPGAPETTLGEPDVDTAGIAGFDESWRFVLTVSIDAPETNESFVLSADLAAVRQGRVIVATSVLQLTDSVDNEAIVEAVRQRLDDVLGG